jgi:hypothetical protein
MISLKCEICGAETKPAKNEAQAKKNLGLHKRLVHNIHGVTGRERYYVDKKGMTLEQAKATIAAKDSGVPPAPRTVKPKTDVVPMALHYCPFCGSRFYGAKGANEHQD